MSSGTLFSLVKIIIACAVLIVFVDFLISKNIGKLERLIHGSNLDINVARIGVDFLVLIVILALAGGYGLFKRPISERLKGGLIQYLKTIPTALPKYVSEINQDVSEIYHNISEYYHDISEFYVEESPPPYEPFWPLKTDTSIVPTKPSPKAPMATPIRTSTEKPTPRPANTELPKPTHTMTLTPTLPIISSKVAFSRTTNQEVSLVDSIWNAFGLESGLEIGNYYKSFEIPVKASDRYRWTYQWCAKDQELLLQNLSGLSIDFIIDGVSLSDEVIYEYDRSLTAWECHYWATTLSNWKVGTDLSLIIRLGLQSVLGSNRKALPDGEYELELLVTVFP